MLSKGITDAEVKRGQMALLGWGIGIDPRGITVNGGACLRIRLARLR